MEPLSKRSDQELLLLLQNGDAHAYTEIFNRYTKLLIAHAYRMLGDKDEAYDVVQEVLLNLWQKHTDLNVSTSLSSYLYAAVRNRIFNHFSHQKIIARYADSIMAFVGSRQVLSDDLLIGKELAALIEKEIANLPAAMREIFLLRKREELSYAEIADKLDITEAAAKQQTYNAVKLLRLKITSLMSVMMIF